MKQLIIRQFSLICVVLFVIILAILYTPFKIFGVDLAELAMEKIDEYNI